MSSYTINARLEEQRFLDEHPPVRLEGKHTVCLERRGESMVIHSKTGDVVSMDKVAVLQACFALGIRVSCRVEQIGVGK